MTERMNKPSALILRLCKKIKTDLNIEVDPATFRRTRAGYWQRSLGAWSWYILSAHSARDFGSQDPVTECVKSKYRLELSDDGTIDAILKK